MSVEVNLEVVCGEAEASCHCIQPPSHDGPHVCGCSGSWSRDADGSFRIHALPGFGFDEDDEEEAAG